MKKLILTMMTMSILSTFCYAESCKGSPVKVEYKADEANCTYQTRTCCDNKQWSDWDADCDGGKQQSKFWVNKSRAGIRNREAMLNTMGRNT